MRKFTTLLFVLVLLAVSALAIAPNVAQAQAAWAPNVAYSIGALVTYGGHTYKCQQAHTSQVGWEPPNTPALWIDEGAVTGGATLTTAPTTAPSKTFTPTAVKTNTPSGATATNTTVPTKTNTPMAATATKTNTPI